MDTEIDENTNTAADSGTNAEPDVTESEDSDTGEFDHMVSE